MLLKSEEPGLLRNAGAVKGLATQPPNGRPAGRTDMIGRNAPAETWNLRTRNRGRQISSRTTRYENDAPSAGIFIHKRHNETALPSGAFPVPTTVASRLMEEALFIRTPCACLRQVRITRRRVIVLNMFRRLMPGISRFSSGKHSKPVHGKKPRPQYRTAENSLRIRLECSEYRKSSANLKKPLFRTVLLKLHDNRPDPIRTACIRPDRFIADPDSAPVHGGILLPLHELLDVFPFRHGSPSPAVP